MDRGILYIILIFFNPILGLDDNYFNQCITFANTCNHSILNPCCDRNNICTLKSPSNSYTCRKKVQLGMFCEHNDDCDEILHAKCSKNKICVCRLNNVQLNETTCSPLLGEFCWRNELCATENSLCINNECQCKSNYLRQSNQCIQMTLGSHCKNDDACSEVEFSKCTDDICKCSFNYTQIDSRLCAPLLGGFCQISDDCVSFNALCIHKICKCPPYFVETSDDKCLPAYFKMACTSNEECTRHMKYSKCSSMNMCVCLKTYFPINAQSCAPTFNKFCKINEPCANINSMCIDNKCQCKPDYIYRSLQCIPLKLNGSCKFNEDCDKIENAVCIENECVCNTNYIESYNSTCEPLLGGLCSKNDQCIPHNSICVDNVCKCRFEYVQKSNEKCLPYCQEIKYSVCSKNNKCVCKQNYTAWGDTECKALIGEYCDGSEECLFQDSTCSDNKCQCRENFTSQSGKYCKPVGLGKACKTDSNCSMITNAICSHYKICTCFASYYALSELACAPIIGGYCENSNHCFHRNNDPFSHDPYNCINNECQCNPNSTSISDSQCIDTSLLHSCNGDADCADLLHAQCYLNKKKCVCKHNNIALNKLTCFPLIGGYCTADYQCMADNTVCIDNQCQCKPNSVFVAQNSCAYTQN
ncbi:prion-like-(Q/N-rich) domain-bearing protein 25 isoform X2 [Microplitis demolitor]|uniref:prion-like-(Q/N-rich) domain-bearing protein 25 isoform X2 n=1 Tax=Microplitis demolitor TaxID=69319 RepID=UPI0004CDA907|nr:prion-like-(Q/N-rich) domain-bearing protein 25 isoform X2 [Microplitis demolitor]